MQKASVTVNYQSPLFTTLRSKWLSGKGDIHTPSEPGFNLRWYRVPIGDNGGRRKHIRSKLLQYGSKSPIYLGTHVRALEQGSQ